MAGSSAPIPWHQPVVHVEPGERRERYEARLALEWCRATLSQNGLPWHGMGLIADVELIMQILNKREWLEAMHQSDDPVAQQFAAELLADDETLDAAWNAAEHARALPKDTDTLDPVAVTEALDEAATKAQETNRRVRRVLELAGVADDATTDDELPDLLRALLA